MPTTKTGKSNAKEERCRGSLATGRAERGHGERLDKVGDKTVKAKEQVAGLDSRKCERDKDKRSHADVESSAQAHRAKPRTKTKRRPRYGYGDARVVRNMTPAANRTDSGES